MIPIVIRVLSLLFFFLLSSRAVWSYVVLGVVVWWCMAVWVYQSVVLVVVVLVAVGKDQTGTCNGTVRPPCSVAVLSRTLAHIGPFDPEPYQGPQ